MGNGNMSSLVVVCKSKREKNKATTFASDRSISSIGISFLR